MVKIKKDNLIEKNDLDLNKKLVTLREEIRVIKFKAEGSRSKNVKELASLKKEIARTLTAINSKKVIK